MRSSSREIMRSGFFIKNFSVLNSIAVTMTFSPRRAVMPAKEALAKAKAAIKSLELDSAQGEAHNSLAFVLDGFDWDLDSGGKEFWRAIELSPSYATAHSKPHHFS